MKKNHHKILFEKLHKLLWWKQHKLILNKLHKIGLLILLIISASLLWSHFHKNSSDDIQTVVQTYTTESSRSMQYLDLLVMKGPEAINEVKQFINDSDPKARWIAVYVIGRVSNHDTVKILLPLLQDQDETVRISAAGTLANKGYKEGLPVLIDALNSVNTIAYLHPEREIADFCLDVLNTYTKQTITTQADWQTWWNANQSSLQWNDVTKTYE